MIFDLGQELAGLDLEHADRPIVRRGGDPLAIRAESDREDDVLRLGEIANRLASATGFGNPESGNAVDARIAAGRGQPFAVGTVGNIVNSFRKAV